FLLRILREGAPLVVVARLCPRIDRTITQRTIGVGDNQRLVILENRTKPVALRAGAARRVEGEELGRGRRCPGAIVRALEALGKAEARNGHSVEGGGDAVSEQDDDVAITFAEGGGDSISETAARIRTDHEAINDDEQLL